MIKRYTTPEMEEIWSDSAKYRRWLDVELAVVKAREILGEFPRGIHERMREKIRLDPERIESREKITRHDLVAFVETVLEDLGNDGIYFHRGLTSSDVVDTALALAMKRAGEIILEELNRLVNSLKGLADEHKYTLVVGRTHGVHAEPTSFGLKILSFVDEGERNIGRLTRALNSISHAKISGAVGNYAHVSPEVERLALSMLGLKACRVSSQIVPRDRHAEYMVSMAFLGNFLERLALEIRHLHRTEVSEVAEPFESGQRGSSAMPHKRNPIVTERICGMSRMLRSYAIGSLENTALWHERDISHSCVERVFIPDATTLVHYMLLKIRGLIENLRIFKDRMMDNMEMTKGLIYSQRVMLALIEHGMDRKTAYDLVQELSFKTLSGDKTFKELLLEDERVSGLLDEDEIEDLFDPGYFIRYVDEIYNRFERGK